MLEINSVNDVVISHGDSVIIRCDIEVEGEIGRGLKAKVGIKNTKNQVALEQVYDVVAGEESNKYWFNIEIDNIKSKSILPGKYNWSYGLYSDAFIDESGALHGDFVGTVVNAKWTVKEVQHA